MSNLSSKIINACPSLNTFLNAFTLGKDGLTYIEFQKYLKTLGMHYTIDDVSELLFPWMPKTGAFGYAELSAFYNDLKYTCSINS